MSRLNIVRVFLFFLISGCFWSSLSLLPSVHPAIEISQSLGLYFLLGHVVGIVFLPFFLSMRVKTRLLVLIWNILLLGHYGFILRQWYTQPELPSECRSENGIPITAFFANVYTRNARYSDLATQIQGLNPDFVGLVEVDEKWLLGLDLSAHYPYSVEIPRPGNFGIALYARYPITQVEGGYGTDLVPSIRAVVDAGPLAGMHLSLIHARPPLSREAHTHNRLLIRRMATEIRHTGAPFLVMGDFNSTLFSSQFRKLLWGGEMQHAGQGREYFSTWDANDRLFRFMFDHILYAGCIRTENYERGSWFGSDHYPLYFHGTVTSPQ